MPMVLPQNAQLPRPYMILRIRPISGRGQDIDVVYYPRGNPKKTLGARVVAKG